MGLSLHSFANKNIMYVKYVVERKDGKRYEFTYADLKNLCPYDHPQLHAFIEQRLEKRKRVQNHKWMYKGMKRPNDLIPGIEDIPYNTLIVKPENGFVYKVDDGMKKIFKPHQSHKYSNNTLMKI
ncbi:hypothetical protein L6452_18251 [Arctium lappa]|uniref:Uncharacterized protein n=1 Tax=Arctium lappa TaxID=4217 RepID=A0ACB9C5X1_ARCLA|nr:hypothetical protein L6452_18251 [Arctium lappa]